MSQSLKTVAVPRYATVPDACAILGFQKSKLYELAGEGQIRLVKVGARSLVDMEVALTWMENLPIAAIAAPRRPLAA